MYITDEIGAVLSVLFMRRGAVCAPLWGVFRHAGVVCVVCLLMLVEDAGGEHIDEAYSRDGYLISSYESLFLFAPCCGCECFNYL